MKAGRCSAPKCLQSLPRGDAVELGCKEWREVSSADRAATRAGVGTAFHFTPPSDFQADTVQGRRVSPDSGGVGAPSTHAWGLFCPPSLSPVPVGSPTPARVHVETIPLWRGACSFPPLSHNACHHVPAAPVALW